MPVMESTLPNITTTVPFDTRAAMHDGESSPVTNVAVERNSNYMANMILPEIVQSSRKFPLGPDCIITYAEVPDQSQLLDMDLYWYISLEKGCVECRVNVCNTGITRKATTSDPRVIITRKPRRFEAYCCFICRANFVTVVQALLHMKAFHRQKKRILIQDQNVFHDIDKAMEVPPVPLPWYVAKKVVSELNMQKVIPPIHFTASSAEMNPATTTVPAIAGSEDLESSGEVNPVTSLLQSIVKEYGKQVQTVLFGKDFSEVKVQFEDKTSVLAQLPDLVSQEENDINDVSDPNEKLDFQVYRVASDEIDEDLCIVRMSNPTLAQRTIISALKQGVSQSSDLKPEEEGNGPESKSTSENTNSLIKIAHEPIDTPPPVSPQPKKLDSRGRPVKTVRFMVGYPDSDEEASSSASERTDREESVKVKATSTDLPPVNDKKTKTKEDEGLKGVVNKLISTASKGLIAPLDPTSPVVTSASSAADGVREEILATAALHVRNLPKNLSVPNLSMADISSSMSTPVITSVINPQPSNSGITRVQSWGGSSDISNKFMLSTYTPSTPQKLETMSPSELRKSFFTSGRAFTYAEKIKLMKKLNDEDSMITQAHVRGAGKLIENETPTPPPPPQPPKQDRRKTRKSSSSSTTPQDSESSEVAATPVITIVQTEATPEEVATKRKSTSGWSTDGRRKRKSKYDVDQFLHSDIRKTPSEKRRKKRPPSSSEGSLSDYDEKDAHEQESMEEREINSASLFDVMRSSYTGLLAPRSGLFSGQVSQDVPVSFPSMLQSEYYGSGEWANAAMQNLRNIQASLVAAPSSNLLPPKWEEEAENHVKREVEDNEESDSGSRTPSPYNSAVITKTNDTVLDNIKIETTDIPSSNPSSTHLQNQDEIIARYANEINEERLKSQATNHSEGGSFVRNKRALSPLLTPGEKQMIRSRAGPGEHSRKKVKGEKLNKFASKSASDPNIQRRSVKEQLPKIDSVIATKGDNLEFLGDVTTSMLNKNEKLTMKFCKNSANSEVEEDQSSSAMDMPQIFQNSVDTFVRVRYVEKFSVCRVCGFTLTVDDKTDAPTMNSHVMEHSLKELLQTGYSGKQMLE